MSSSAMAVDGVAQVDDGTTKEQQLETEVADLRCVFSHSRSGSMNGGSDYCCLGFGCSVLH